MTETTQPDPQLGTATWRITEWFRDYRRTRPGGGTYGDAVTKLSRMTVPLYGDDVLSACWTLAEGTAARKPLTVADIPAGQGPASLYIGPGHRGELAVMYRTGLTHDHVFMTEGPDDPTEARRAMWDHLAATLPTVTTEEEA